MQGNFCVRFGVDGEVLCFEDARKLGGRGFLRQETQAIDISIVGFTNDRYSQLRTMNIAFQGGLNLTRFVSPIFGN